MIYDNNTFDQQQQHPQTEAIHYKSSRNSNNIPTHKYNNNDSLKKDYFSTIRQQQQHSHSQNQKNIYPTATTIDAKKQQSSLYQNHNQKYIGGFPLEYCSFTPEYHRI